MKHFNVKQHSSMEPVDDWVLVYDFQKESHDFPFSSNQKCLTVKIWESSARDVGNQRKYSSMFAYAEVIDEADGELWHQSFFGETCGDDAFRWANDKTNKELN